MATRAIPPPVNETEHSVSRITREGKKITYKLNVMQQPERARACGAGAKSSADRRPVDPPPVVELRIFESDPHDDSHKTDITFAYNANFFLYATLDTARPMAQGRLAPAPNFPVLTGVPVAGVAYLDRPSQAGYFIFPDLSVRHEGVYRLSFHLYEETKDSKDATEGTPMVPNTIPSIPSIPSAPQSFLEFRLEVVSVPFTVFSAKKFPGLTTSTSLSRIIAEQGCRVRIRRDVRMRRRGDKRSDDYDYEEERVYNSRHPDRYSTPDTYSANPPDRPRSTSISTHDHSYSYSPQRQPPGPDYGHQNPQPYQRPIPPAPVAAPAPSSSPAPPPASVASSAPAPVPSPIPRPPATASALVHSPAPPALPSSAAPPPPPPHTPTYQSHLSFGSTQTQYPAPQLSCNPQPATAASSLYSPRLSYSHTRNSSCSTEYESPTTGYPYAHSRLQNEHPGYKSTALPPLRLPNARMQSGEGHHPSGQPGGPRSQTPSNTSLPPLKSLSGEFPPSLCQPPSAIVSSPSHDLGSGSRLLWETGQTLSKRSHDESFGHDDRPLYNGMRPDSDSYPGSMQRRPSFGGRAGHFGSSDQMAYKRANGRMATKISPAIQ